MATKKVEEINENEVKEVKEVKATKKVVNIAKDLLNPKIESRTVTINGKETIIPLGKMVEVSEDVFAVLKDAKLVD